MERQTANPLKQKSLQSFFAASRPQKDEGNALSDQIMSTDGPSHQDKRLDSYQPPKRLSILGGQNGASHANGTPAHGKQKQEKAGVEVSGAIKPAPPKVLRIGQSGGEPQGIGEVGTAGDVDKRKKRRRKKKALKQAVAGLPPHLDASSSPKGRGVLSAAGEFSQRTGTVPKLTECGDTAGVAVPFVNFKSPSESPMNPDSFVGAQIAFAEGVTGAYNPTAAPVMPASVPSKDGAGEAGAGLSARKAGTASVSPCQVKGEEGAAKLGGPLPASLSRVQLKPAPSLGGPNPDGQRKHSGVGKRNRKTAELAGDARAAKGSKLPKKAQSGEVCGAVKGPPLSKANSLLPGFESSDELISRADERDQNGSAALDPTASPVRKSGRAKRLSVKANELIEYSPQEATGVRGLGLGRRPEGALEELGGLQKQGRGAPSQLGVLSFGAEEVGRNSDVSLADLSRLAAQMDGERDPFSDSGEGNRPGSLREGLPEAASQGGEEKGVVEGDAKVERGGVLGAQSSPAVERLQQDGRKKKNEKKKEKWGPGTRIEKEGAPGSAPFAAAVPNGLGNMAKANDSSKKGHGKSDLVGRKGEERGRKRKHASSLQAQRVEGSEPAKQGDRKTLTETEPIATAPRADSEPGQDVGIIPMTEVKLANLADVCLRESQSAASPPPAKKARIAGPATPASKQRPVQRGAGPVMKTCVNCGRTGLNKKGQFYRHPFTGEPCCAFCFHPTTPAKKKALEAGEDPDEAVRAVLLERKARYGKEQAKRAANGASGGPVPPFKKAPRSPRTRRTMSAPGETVRVTWQSRIGTGSDERRLSAGPPSADPRKVTGTTENGEGKPGIGTMGVPLELGGKALAAKPLNSKSKHGGNQLALGPQVGSKVESLGGLKRKKGPEAASPKKKRRKGGEMAAALSPVKGADATKNSPKSVGGALGSSLPNRPALSKSPLEKLVSSPFQVRPTPAKKAPLNQVASKRSKAAGQTALSQPSPASPAYSHRLETPPSTPKAGGDAEKAASRTPSKPPTSPYARTSAGDDDVSKGAVASGSPEGLAAALAEFRERKKAEGVFHEMPLKGVLPKALMGRKCKVYWPMDAAFYAGHVHQYNNQTGKHTIVYEDGYEEVILLAEQRIQLQVFPGRDPILVTDSNTDGDGGSWAVGGGPKKKRKREQLGAPLLAELGPNGLPNEGEAVWGKVKGHAAWPCLVMSEEQAVRVALEPGPRETAATTVPVQFFGTYEVGRLRSEQLETFHSGLHKGLNKKLKGGSFLQALKETEAYLRHCQVPPGMQAIFSLAEDSSSGEEDLPILSPRKPSPKPVPKSEPETPVKPFLNQASKPVGKAPSMPIQCAAQLTVYSLGTISRGKNFHTSSHIFPVGFRSTRTFYSMKDPEARVKYTMEILEGQRNGAAAPLFRITPEDCPPLEGYDTRALWLDVTQRIGSARERLGQPGGVPYFKSGPSMFGFSDIRIVPLIESLPHASEWCTSYAAWHGDTAPARASTPLPAKPKPPPQNARTPNEPPPAAYVPLDVTFRHDRCSVCYTVEEYDDNQLLQCDKCRVMVHMHCYGVMEPPDGDLWLCQLCQEDAPREPPRCCLCPVAGGAMKPTSDGRWAHLTCAIWIPETLLNEQHQIERVDAIPKDRWNLRCSICRVKYGACIQCEEKSCKTAFHPLCARGRGLCMEVVTHKDVPSISRRSRERGRTPLAGAKEGGGDAGTARGMTPGAAREERAEDGESAEQRNGRGQDSTPEPEASEPAARDCLGASARGVRESEVEEGEEALRLLAWCARHKQPEAGEVGRVTVKERRDAAAQVPVCAEDYVPPANPSGCARTEPFDPAARRGQRAPEAVATALAKRLFVRQVPYEITGRRWAPPPGLASAKASQTLDRRKAAAGPRAGLAAAGDALEAGSGLLGDGPKSATERYIMMKTTQGERLAFGKSAIHGWGVFAKQRHAQASFVTEYAGEVVRQAVADAREKNLYNSLVGAGTYMFRIDDQRVVDATKAGSLAHLINHACEPNCFSRVVRADGDEHIVITAKRDILPGEEFTYDYRFNSKDEILPCNCGAPSCRGTVNFYDDDEADEYGRVMAPISEIKPWDPTKIAKSL